MWYHKQLILTATRKGLSSCVAKSSSRVVLRNSRRCLSSALPDYRHENEDGDHSTDAYTQKQEALQKMLKATRVATPENRTVTPTNDEGTLHTQNDKSFQSPSELTYTGGATMPVTSDLHIVTPDEDTPRGVWPIFRIMVGGDNACEAALCRQITSVTMRILCEASHVSHKFLFGYYSIG